MKRGPDNPFAGHRPASASAPPNPNFRKQYRAVGSEAIPDTATIFSPNGTCTVQWMLAQVSADCIIQPLINGQPFGVPLSVTANAIIRFAGTLLIANETLGFSVSTPVTVNFEVVWLKEFCLDLIAKETYILGNGPSGGGAAHQNVNIFSSSGGPLTDDGSGALNVDCNSIGPVTVDGTVNIGNAPFFVKIQDSNGSLITLGQKIMAASLPVVMASDQSTIKVIEPQSATATAPASTAVTNAASTILAANANRKQAIIVNRDIYTVYLGLGSNPTAIAYHIALQPCQTADDGTGGVFITDVWTGDIDAIVSSTTGHVCVTELT